MWHCWNYFQQPSTSFIIIRAFKIFIRFKCPNSNTIWVNSKIQKWPINMFIIFGRGFHLYQKSWTFSKGILGSLKMILFEPIWIHLVLGFEHPKFKFIWILNMMTWWSSKDNRGWARVVTFLQPCLLAANPSSCHAASSPPTLLLVARPRRYGQVIHTPPTPSSSFPVPHAPTDGATPSTEITAPYSN